MTAAYVVTAPYVFGYKPDGSHSAGVYSGYSFPTDGLAEGEADRLVDAGLIAAVKPVAAVVVPATVVVDDVDGAGPIPPKSADKGTWVAFAVAQGADPEGAEKATKDELVELYGKG